MGRLVVLFASPSALLTFMEWFHKLVRVRRLNKIENSKLMVIAGSRCKWSERDNAEVDLSVEFHSIQQLMIVFTLLLRPISLQSTGPATRRILFRLDILLAPSRFLRS